MLARLSLICLIGLLITGFAQDEKPVKPSILFALPGANTYATVGYDYLRSLAQQGFEVDYSEGSREFTLDRLKQFDVVMIFSFPPVDAHDAQWLFALHPPFTKDYLDVLKQYADAGGSVFFFITGGGMSETPNDFLKANWGLQLPNVMIHDPSAQPMTNLPTIKLAYTGKIEPSPVSEGIRGFWYPLGQHYIGGHTMPVMVDDAWTVVARTGDGAYTAPPTWDRGGFQPREGLLMPKESIPNAPLLAIRELPAGGRMAAMQIWYQFTVGSGDKWLFDNQVMAKGISNRPSDLGKLLVNTYRWLAAAPMATGKVGGHVTPPERLEEPQLRPGAMDQWKVPVFSAEKAAAYEPRMTPGWRLFRGLIGAQTALSVGEGSVEDYAKAASAAGLDFVVFTEDFTKFSEDKLKTLVAETRRLSTDKLLLLPGYQIEANTGNHLFCFSTEPLWPTERMLTGPGKTILNLQYQDENGEYARGNPVLDWCLSPNWHNTGNIGYYDFSHSGDGMRMHDLRVYSMAAVRTYRNGELVDDALDDYLVTCQSFAVPTPINMALVRSPAELTAQAASGKGLTWAQARAMHTLVQDSLRWSHQNDGLNVFATDGPVIEAWPKLARVITFGAERFVTPQSLDVAPIVVTSDVGLKQITIYNGRELYRRFDCKGAKEFKTTLFLTGVVQRSLVLVAEDTAGAKAVSFSHRSFKDSSLCPVFCSDHVNDCGHMLLAHGPAWPALGMVPVLPLSVSGSTWDGGAGLAQRPLYLTPHFTHPWVHTSAGTSFEMPYNTPLVESSDEGYTRCRALGGRRVSIDAVRAYGNPWMTFGPIEPTPLFDSWASHAYFGQYTTGVEPMGYGGPGILGGPIGGLFTEEFTWKQPCTINFLQMWMSGWRKKIVPESILLVVGNADGSLRDVVDATVLPDQARKFDLATGDWFGLISAGPSNSSLIINRGGPLRLQLNRPDSYWMQLFAAIDKQEVKAGDTYRVETFSEIWPLDQSITNAATLAGVVRWFNDPDGLELKRGTRGPRHGGLFELTPDNGAVEFVLPQEKRFGAVLPVRVNGLNRRWTAGLYMVDGYRTHYYSKENAGWRELGLDFAGSAYVPVYASMAPSTHLLIGQPIVADGAGKDLFIQVTRLNDGIDDAPPDWHVSVNNAGGQPVTTTLRQTMALPGLTFGEKQITIQPGEYKILAPAATAE